MVAGFTRKSRTRQRYDSSQLMDNPFASSSCAVLSLSPPSPPFLSLSLFFCRRVILTRDDDTVFVIPYYRGGKEKREKVGSDGYARSSLYGVYRRLYLSCRLWNATVWCTARSRLGRNVLARDSSSHVFTPVVRDVQVCTSRVA